MKRSTTSIYITEQKGAILYLLLEICATTTNARDFCKGKLLLRDYYNQFKLIDPAIAGYIT